MLKREWAREFVCGVLRQVLYGSVSVLGGAEFDNAGAFVASSLSSGRVWLLADMLLRDGMSLMIAALPGDRNRARVPGGNRRTWSSPMTLHYLFARNPRHDLPWAKWRELCWSAFILE
jgi:hypothetical protein